MLYVYMYVFRISICKWLFENARLKRNARVDRLSDTENWAALGAILFKSKKIFENKILAGYKMNDNKNSIEISERKFRE